MVARQELTVSKQCSCRFWSATLSAQSLSLIDYSNNAGSGLPHGPFWGNNIFPHEIGCTPRGSCNNTRLLEGFLEGSLTVRAS